MLIVSGAEGGLPTLPCFAAAAAALDMMGPGRQAGRQAGRPWRVRGRYPMRFGKLAVLYIVMQ